VGAAVRVPRITSKNLIRCVRRARPAASQPPLQPPPPPSPGLRSTQPRRAGAGPRPRACARRGPNPACPLSPLRRSIIFCEAVAIYGVIVAIILQTKLENVSAEAGLYSKSNMAAGYAIFAAGLTCGLSNLVCGCVWRRPQRRGRGGGSVDRVRRAG
jgi:F0F1-type ATP synthase membrane subunit c/vacuolar-type H+-ATPase subunit K